MILYGIQIMTGKGAKQFKIAKLIGLPVLNEFENDNIKIQGTGFAPKSDTTGRPQFPDIEPNYAHKLYESQAFVPNKDYRVEAGMNEQTLQMEVTKLIPVDPQVKQHFEASLKAFEDKDKSRSEQIKDFENKGK